MKTRDWTGEQNAGSPELNSLEEGDRGGGERIVQVELNIDDQFTFLKAICFKKSLEVAKC